MLLKVIAVMAILVIVVMIYDCNRFVIRKYTCRSGKLQKGITFILLSDMHNKFFGKDNQRLLQAIERENPDAILIAGDMYTSSVKEDNKQTAEFVNRLSARYPVYYGNGNHEQKTRLFPETFGTMYQDYMDRIKQGGAVTLINEKISLPEYSMELYGLETDRSYYRKFKKKKMEKEYLNRVLGRPKENCFNILIAHNPDYFETYAEWGADLTVSGHVHGGLMKLPFLGGVVSPKLTLFPRYDGGRFEKGGRIMILSRGLGTHTLPIRIFNPGELVVIELEKE